MKVAVQLALTKEKTMCQRVGPIYDQRFHGTVTNPGKTRQYDRGTHGQMVKAKLNLSKLEKDETNLILAA